jgi:hypothetical protein
MSVTTEGNQTSSDSLSVDVQAKQSEPVPHGKWQRFSRFLVEKGPAITVIALVLSALQFAYAAWSTQQINRIADSISTQYVDVFPNNMPDIISLINRTQKNLTVITDVAAYGHFSSPDNSTEYIRALNDLNNSKKGVQIQILYYEPTKGAHKLAEQFASEISDWKAFTDGSAYLNYSKYHQGNLPQDAESLYRQIIQAGEKLRTNLQGINSRTKVTTTSDDLQIFMWIRDGEEAMFSLHNYGPNTREDSFKTIDKRFITRLKAIADEEFKKAGGVPLPQPQPSNTPQNGGEAGVSPQPSVAATASPKQ